MLNDQGHDIMAIPAMNFYAGSVALDAARSCILAVFVINFGAGSAVVDPPSNTL